MKQERVCNKGRRFGYDAWCVGLFLVISFPTAVSLLMGGRGSETASWVLSLVPTLARVLAFGVVALLARRIVSLVRRPVLLAMFAVLMAAGVFGRAAVSAGLAGDAAEMVSTVSSIAVNSGYAVLYLGWMELYSQMDFKHVLVYFTIAHFLSALLSYVLFSLGSSLGMVLFVAVMPFAGAAMLRVSDLRTQGTPYRQGEVQRFTWTISPRPIVLLAVFTFSNSVIRGFLGTEGQAAVLLGVCVAALCILVAVLLRFGRFEVKSLYQVSVPVLVAGALFVLMDGAWCGVAAALCSNAAFTLFSVFVTAVFCGIAYRYGVNALWMFGIIQASLAFGSLAGKAASLLGGALLFDGPSLVVTMSVLVVMLVALSMTLVSDRDFATTWGIVDKGEKGEAGSSLVDEEERLSRTCARIAQRYGLTRREEEVLVLMMRGHTLARIGEELFIAESTMKTHSRHIYRKVGVSNRNELQELVDSRIKA